MSIRTYITSSDCTSIVFSDFNLSGYIDATNNHLDYLSYSLDVSPSSVEDEIIAPILKEYGVYYTYRQASLDKLGANNTELGTDDKYLMLYEVFNNECERLRKYLTKETFSGDADSSVEMSPTMSLIRG